MYPPPPVQPYGMIPPAGFVPPGPSPYAMTYPTGIYIYIYIHVIEVKYGSSGNKYFWVQQRSLVH